jgi:hypothetical protein
MLNVSARRTSSPNRERSGDTSPSSGSPTAHRPRSSTNRTPRVHVPPVPHAASAVNQGSREIATYVAPASHREEGLRAKYASHRPSGDRSHRCGYTVPAIQAPSS